jgi:hypothetical protein
LQMEMASTISFRVVSWSSSGMVPSIFLIIFPQQSARRRHLRHFLANFLQINQKIKLTIGRFASPASRSPILLCSCIIKIELPTLWPKKTSCGVQGVFHVKDV